MVVELPDAVEVSVVLPHRLGVFFKAAFKCAQKVKLYKVAPAQNLVKDASLSQNRAKDRLDALLTDFVVGDVGL